MTMTRNEFAVRVEYTLRAGALLEHVALRGARHDPALVEAFQSWYNTNLGRLQNAYAAGGATAQLLGALVPITVDRLWGTETSSRATLPFIPPLAGFAPRRSADVAAWFRTNERAIRYTMSNAQARLAEMDTQPDSFESDAGPAASPALPGSEANPIEGDQIAVEGRRLLPTAPRPTSVSWFAVFGIAAVLGVGGFLFWKLRTRKGSKQKRLAA